MAGGDGKRRRKRGLNIKKMYSRTLVKTFNHVDFLRLADKIYNSKSAAHWHQRFENLPDAWPNQEELSQKAVELVLDQLKQNGEEVDREEIEKLIEAIRVRYYREGHVAVAVSLMVLFDWIFDVDNSDLPFVSNDKREIQHLDKLQAHIADGKGVVYMVNHSSHFDEFLVDILWQHMIMGLPLFAAGQNMMTVKSLGKLLNLGLYVVLRQGASRHQMSALYNYCRAISEIGGQQGIFLEAWHGGARTRDGSLRYPRRLVTLRGAIDVSDDVVVQPIALSYSVVPEDLPLCARGSARAWIRGIGFWHTLGQMLLHPKAWPLHAAKNLYGRAYVSVPKPMLLSELKELHAKDKGGLALDEFVTLYCIKEIARTKKIMASQLVARGVVRARHKGERNLKAAVDHELELIREYHQSAFGQEPDIEDFITNNPIEKVIEDGLATLKQRGVLSRWRKDDLKLPLVLSEAGLSYYATHGDRRIYSPTADQNIVVVGAGNWGFALSRQLAGRLLETKKYDNASLTLFDTRPEVVEAMNQLRTGTGRFSEELLPKNIFVTHDLPSAFRKASEIVLACRPEDFVGRLEGILSASEQPFKLMVATRGFVPEYNLPPVLVARQLASRAGRDDVKIYTLAGPVTPEDMVEGQPIRGRLAGPQPGLDDLADLFNQAHCGVDTSHDAVGVEIADIMARIYGMWVSYVIRSDRQTRAQDLGRLMADAAGESRKLAISLGGLEETFRAGGYAWTETYVAVTLKGDVREFGRLLARQARKQKDIPTAAKKLNRQMREDGHGIQTLEDLKLARLAARKLGLELPMLEEAHQVLFGEND